MSTSDKCLYSPTFCVYDLDYSDNGLSIHLHSFLMFENNGYPPPVSSWFNSVPTTASSGFKSCNHLIHCQTRGRLKIQNKIDCRCLKKCCTKIVIFLYIDACTLSFYYHDNFKIFNRRFIKLMADYCYIERQI